MTGLAFFHSYYLWALFFLFIPLIIHLIRRRRIIKLNFSSIRFLKDSAVKASRISRLRNILLLLTRLLIIILMILIFAQLYNKRDPFRIITGSNTALFCWIDATISMGYKRKELSLWHEACEMTAVFDTVLPSTARFYCYDGRIDDFIDIRQTGLSENIMERFTPLRHGSTDLENMLQKFKYYKKNESRTPALVLFSDFQAKDRNALEEFFSASKISFPILCVSMAEAHPWNYSVYNTRVSFENNPVLKCDVKARGRGLKAGEVVALIESMRVGQKTVHLKRNDSLAVSIDIGRRGERSRGELRLMNNDPYAYDNSSYFVERKSGKQHILIISEGDESFPIVAALRSLSASRPYQPLVKEPIDVSYDDLDSSEIIVLCSVREPTEILSALWRRSALSDKVILYAPNVDDKAGSLNGIVFRHLKAVPEIDKIKTDKAYFPVLPDTVSSLWRGFPRFTDRDVSFYAFYTPIPGDVLLRLNKGMPLVSHCIDSSGYSWIVFASPIGITNANNLCETGFFVPFLDRVIRYGCESVKRKHDMWIAGCPINNPYSGSRMSAQVFNSDNKRIAIWDRQPQVSLENPGLYKIHPHGEPAYWIAAIADPSEGDLIYQKPDIAAFNKSNIKFLNRSSFMNFIRHDNSLGFDFLWLLLAVCLILEVLLWKRKKI